MATKYHLTDSELKETKKACKVAGLDWKSIASRPITAKKLISRLKEEGKL